MSAEAVIVPENLTVQARQQYATATKKSVEFVRQLALFGQTLHRVKEIVGHGGFLSWIEENFDFSERTAQVYMSLWTHIKEIEGAKSVSESLRMIKDSEQPEPNTQSSALLPKPTPKRTTRTKEVVVDAEVVEPAKPTSWTAPQQPDLVEEVKPVETEQNDLEKRETKIEELRNKIYNSSLAACRRILNQFDPDVRGQLLIVMVMAYEDVWNELWSDPDLADHPFHKQFKRLQAASERAMELVNEQEAA
jgi:Protein of unknown function (DUF3102)